MAMSATVNQLERLDEELETILTSFNTNYAWRYGNVKEGLRDLYEKQVWFVGEHLAGAPSKG